MEMSEEQKQRMEANRAAALARRNAKLHAVVEPSTLVRLPMLYRMWEPQPNVFAEPWSNPEMAHVGCQPQTDCSNQSRNEEVFRLAENHAFPPISAIVNLSASRVPQSGEGLKISTHAPSTQQLLEGCILTDEKVKVSLEMCAPARFVLVVKGGLGNEGNRYQKILEIISCVAKCENLEPSAKWPEYNLKDYIKVTNALKSLRCILYEPIPWSTRMILEKFQKGTERGVPAGPGHITDVEVERLLQNLPQSLLDSLLPFQKQGVRYGLQRGGRCLLADEMGVGKTIQAIAIAACYREEGSLLVICPASMRLVWAEELERWLPYLSPQDVHLVFGRKNDLTQNLQLPKVVVTSYNLLSRLRKSFSLRKWGTIIVDEAHNLRCSTKKLDCEETTAVLELAQNVKRVVLLTGTPSLSRPFDIFNQINCLWPNLLGKNKYEFAQKYCDLQSGPFTHRTSKDYARGSRLQELNVLLKQTVMVRRLKSDVMSQLPPKRRQVICLELAPVDIKNAKAMTAATSKELISANLGEEACNCGFTQKGNCDCEDERDDESSDECDDREALVVRGSSAKFLQGHEIGVAKLRGFQEWLLNNSIFAARESQNETTPNKMIIFAHHHKVLDGVQAFVQAHKLELVRIDGTTLAQDRLKNVNRFQSDPEVKVAIIGVKAGGVGLNFSAAQTVIFVELPKSASEMLQAEDRAHRQGQKNSVNIYIFCAKGTADDTHWQSLSRSLERMSTMTDGAEATLEVECVVDVAKLCNQEINMQPENRVPEDCNESRGIDIIDYSSEDSCVTTATAENITPSNNSTGEPPILNASMDNSTSCSKQVDLSNFQVEAKTDVQGDTLVEFPASSLMFQVSSNTGRIHLYLNSTDESSEPISLQSNFKPEDLIHAGEFGVLERRVLPNYLVNSVSHREAATVFWREWCALRPLFRSRLLGRPLSLPLSTELSSLKNGDQHITGGLLKGGSKRRCTPWEEAGSPPPEGATWKAIRFHKRKGSKETKILQAWTAGGTPLCKYCQQPCNLRDQRQEQRPLVLTPDTVIRGHRSMKPEFFEDLFCQMSCHNEYANKTSRRKHRERLFDLERGVCVKCRLDCHALVERIRPLPSDMRRIYILEKAPHFAKHKQMLEKLIRDPTEGNAWHADHIVAVADGGGESTLENYQTLCIACHAKVTAEQNRRRRSEQLRINSRFQKTMTKLSKKSEVMKRRRTSCTQDDVFQGSSRDGKPGYPLIDSSESEDDQDLLDVNVAGSAYSTFVASDITKSLTEKTCIDIEVPPKHGPQQTCLHIELPGTQGHQSTKSWGSLSEVSLNVDVAGSTYCTLVATGNRKAITKQACTDVEMPTVQGLESTSNSSDSLSEVKADVELAGSAYSNPRAVDISKALKEQACVHIERPALQGLEIINNTKSRSEVSADGNMVSSTYLSSGATEYTKALTEKVCIDISLPTMQGLESTNDTERLANVIADVEMAADAFATSGTYENATVFTEQACIDFGKSLIQGLESISNTDSLSEVEDLRIPVCDISASSTTDRPSINTNPDILVSRTPTFSLKSLSKYIL